MQINNRLLISFIGNVRVSSGEAIKLTRSLYCNALTIRNLCSEDCQKCKPFLTSAFRLEDATRPGALLTYNLRKAVALQQEAAQLTRQVEPIPPKDELFPITERNPFEEFTN